MMDQEDILLEIFSWLPKKSLLRCKSVCKTWQSLIKENASSLAASARWMDQYGSIVLNESSEPRRPTFSRFNNKGCLVHEHAINLESMVGPLCRNASSRNPVVFYCTQENPYQCSYHVYNPLTLHHTRIPPINTSSSKPYGGDPYQIRERSHTKMPDLVPFPVCMGYVPCSEKDCSPDHFKFVVAIYDYISPDPYTDILKIKFSIFHSGTGVWEMEPKKPKKREMEQPIKCYSRRRQTDSRYWPGYVDFMDPCFPCLSIHGNLFWLRHRCIFAFKLKTWKARRIELPHSPSFSLSPTVHRGCFWESDGRLKYCQILPTHLGIWVLEGQVKTIGDNCKWRQIFSLSRDRLDSLLMQAGREPYGAGDTWVSAFDEDHGIIHLQTRQGLLSYDISEKRTTPITASLSFDRAFWGHQPFACNKLNSPAIDTPSRKRKAESEDAITSNVSKSCKH